MKWMGIIVGILVIVGGLNWGLWGLFQFDLVAALFGGNDAGLARIVYSLVGVAAVVMAALLPRFAKASAN
ncbi:MAG: DUF378 domain-containing protein [Phycisphaerales bacterium]|nr:DUF378 domain-containing protein [Phycisphaerales bacterium]